ncbi:MAG: Mov34/MPN/PAD-1 family protein [Dehalococcoidia bacterium]|jgi:proteasome lid subunit RPN8/RPN11|nr:Mov34/MPN/PAD-1 family protein [Dehalococcoidia bacterium]
MTRPEAISISRDILLLAYAEARAAYPAECCGWLAGPAGGPVTSVRACANQQASGNHPTAADRPAETAYVIEGEDLMTLNRDLDGDTPPLVIYHSHPNGRAYLSETDRTVATNPQEWGGGPAYPVQQLVVGIDAQRVVNSALFAWSNEEDGYVELAVFEGAAV